jgi:hypothetical protein
VAEKDLSGVWTIAKSGLDYTVFNSASSVLKEEDKASY